MEYRLVQTPADLLPHLDELRQSKVMAVDTETTGLDPHTNQLRLIQLAVPNCPVLVVDCLPFLPHGRVLLNDIFTNSGVKVLHNAKFDLQFLAAAGLKLTHLFDTMLAAQLLRSSGGPPRANLNAVCSHYLGESVDKTEQTGDWSGELRQQQLAYAARDAGVLLPLRESMLPHLHANKLEDVARIEFGCVQAIAQMEYNGINFDREEWDRLCIQTETARNRALEQLYGYSGRPSYQLSLWGEEEAMSDINFDSNPFVLGLLRKNRIDAPSTSRRHLASYAAHPLVRALFEYRKNTKALSAFLHPIPAMVNPVTGRLHPHYGQIGAWSGRMSCGGPNIQQIPREKAFRRCFCAPPGKKLVLADYSQIELRVAAQISGDERMREAYRKGEDLHTLTASLISHVPADAVTKAQRQAAKAVNFGLIYGMGAAGLQQYALLSYGSDMSLEQAERFRSSFFSAYPGIAAWHRRILAGKPEEERTLSGRKFTFAPNSGLSGLSNTPVQGTAADIAKQALSLLVHRLIGTSAKIVAIVHDEILLEADEADAPEAAQLLRDAMESAGRCVLPDLPCVAEVEITENWAGK